MSCNVGNKHADRVDGHLVLDWHLFFSLFTGLSQWPAVLIHFLQGNLSLKLLEGDEFFATNRVS